MTSVVPMFGSLICPAWFSASAANITSLTEFAESAVHTTASSWLKQLSKIHEKELSEVVTVYGIVPGSIAERNGIKVGDILHTVNGNEIRDVLDYRFYLTNSDISLSIERSGVFYQVKIHKEMYTDIGLEFETYLMDKQRSCRNRCIFCFIDQNPNGMRDSIYFKDDDSRLSFLLGNYITLTNLNDYDIERIVKMHISPVNISVHTTNPELRVEMMKNRRAGEVLKYLKVLSDARIEINAQIVLCRGINDGDELLRSMRELAELSSVHSVSVVPAGMTAYREGLFPLTPFTPEECAEVIKTVTEFGDECVEKRGERLFFCGDEFYVKSGVPLPDEEFYEGYAQIENGVGMITSLRTEFGFALEDNEVAEIPTKTVSCATGYAAYDVICELAKKTMSAVKGLRINVYRIRNDFFGESITVAGLLTGSDIAEQLKDAAQNGDLGEKLLLPRVMLRAEGDLFLDSMTPDELSEKLGVPIEFIESDGNELFSAFI